MAKQEQTALLNGPLKLESRSNAKCEVQLKGEFEPEIDLHKVVFWSVNNFIAGVGENSDVRGETIFETCTNIPENTAVTTAAAVMRKEAAHSAISARSKVNFGREKIQRVHRRSESRRSSSSKARPVGQHQS